MGSLQPRHVSLLLVSFLGILLFPRQIVATDQQVRELQFQRETQNLKIFATQLLAQAPRGFTLCSELEGKARFGRIPHRLSGQGMDSEENFIYFAAVYDEAASPTLLVDLDANHVLSCDERMAPLAHPNHPGLFFRTLIVKWTLDTYPARSQRYRITVPGKLEDDTDAFYSVDLVDVPVSRWKAKDYSTFWILYDGNHNGVFDQRFGDGILIDLSGSRRISVDPYGGNFYSYHTPLILPWGAYEVRDVDPEGRFLTLARLEDVPVSEVETVELGDATRSQSCTDAEGTLQRFGGPSDQYQLLYFWLSYCGTCRADMEAINPMLDELHSNGIFALGISLDEEREAFEQFNAMSHPSWPQCFIGKTLWDNAFARYFGVRNPSDFLIIGPSGKVLVRDTGSERLRQAVGELLSSSHTP